MSMRTGIKAGLGVCAVCLLGYIYLYNVNSINSYTTLFTTGTRTFNTSTLTTINHTINISAFTPIGTLTPRSSVTTANSTRCLLTMFSTWPNDEKKKKVYETTLKNWAYFKPLVRPVFFYNKGQDVTEIKKQGWDVLPLTKEIVGLPVLKQMFVDVIENFDSTFYGFANGDIIFENGLISTLQAIIKAGFVKGKSKPVFLSGIRTNVHYMTEKETSDVKNLARVAKKRGKVFIAMSEDYFITDSYFPWKDIADVVIARRAYDNWLLLRARQLNSTVIDATQTLVAVHQTTSAGDMEHQKAKGNKEYNVILLKKLYKRINYGAGATICAGLRTKWENTTVVISPRKKLDRICSPLN